MTYEFIDWYRLAGQFRTRTREAPYYFRSNSGTIYPGSSRYDDFRDFPSLRLKPDGSYHNKICEHHECIGFWSGQGQYGTYTQLRSLQGGSSAIRHAFREAAEVAYLELDFQQDDNFELFPFLFDIDGKLGNFFGEFANSLTSPAGIKFGLLPTISDFQSLYSSFRTAFGGFEKEISRKQSKRFTRHGPIHVSGKAGSQLKYSFDGTWTLQGTPRFLASSFTPDQFFLMWLDEFGIHPDFKTVWDILPFSFIVDKVVPVGDLLEYLHPRGWYEPSITFDGTFSVSGLTSTSGAIDKNNRQSIISYGRSTQTPIVGTRKPPELNYKAPDFIGAIGDIATILVSR